MALSGEKIDKKIQERIKRMINNHLDLREQKKTIQELEEENASLRQIVN